MKRIFLILWACALWSGHRLEAAAPTWPNLLNYQGQLTDTAGQAVADGNYTLQFKLYSVATGGTALWTETQSVAVGKGLFNAVLGSVTSFSALALSTYGNDLWIGIKVSADPEMAPRQQLLPAVYARNAQSVAGLVPDNSANNMVVLDGSGKIPVGLVQGGSLSLPFAMNGSSAIYGLSILNSNSSPSALGLSVVASNGISTQASDNQGVALWASALDGVGILAQATIGVGISATTGSLTDPSIYGAGAYPARLLVSTAVSGNVGLAVSTPNNDAVVNLVDRANRAAVFATTTVSGAYGVSANASAGTAVYGFTNSTNGGDFGVWGVNTGGGLGAGVYGSGVTGVAGVSSSSAGFGVLGINANSTGVGIVGRHLGTGAGFGVRGSSQFGVGAVGVYGTVSASAATAVVGYALAADSIAVLGLQGSNSPASNIAGVVGRSKSLASGTGVRGEGGQGIYGFSNGTCGVCAFNSNAGGSALFATATAQVIYAESTNVSGPGIAIKGVIQTISPGNAAGQFNALGTSGATYGINVSNDSATGVAVNATGGHDAVHAAALVGGTNMLSDTSNNPKFGFFHSHDPAPANGVGVYALENCITCFGGYFYNVAATNGAGVVGGALFVQGRLHVQDSAGIFSVPALSDTFVLLNDYIKANSLILLTAVNVATSSTATVTSRANGTATITFLPTLPVATDYQFLIIGQ